MFFVSGFMAIENQTSERESIMFNLPRLFSLASVVLLLSTEALAEFPIIKGCTPSQATYTSADTPKAFGGGAGPMCHSLNDYFAEADVNGSGGQVDISDLISPKERTRRRSQSYAEDFVIKARPKEMGCQNVKLFLSEPIIHTPSDHRGVRRHCRI